MVEKREHSGQKDTIYIDGKHFKTFSDNKQLAVAHVPEV